jgi:aminobenzoyl-glutamate transport protein
VERVGNTLPHPVSLFVIATALVVAASAVAAWFDWAVTNPATGVPVAVVNLLSVAGVHRLLNGLVTNFTNFAPLGTVLVAMLGIAVAEGSGLIGAALKRLVLAAPRRWLTLTIVFAGVMSNTGGEVGYVLLLPLSAMVFAAVGRHPLAGLAAAFAGVSGGYSANLLLGTIDPLLAGLTQEAAHLVDPAYRVNPAANYYFMAASTALVAIVGTVVTERVIVPRLGLWQDAAAHAAIEPLTAAEQRGLRFATVAGLVLVAVVLAGILPEGGYLRDLKTGDVLHSPLLSGIVAFIFVGGVVMGVAYGVGAGTVRGEADVLKPMSKSMETMGSYLVLVFFAAQFVAVFNWSNLGLIVAVEGAAVLKALGLGTVPLLVSFVALSAVINLAMGSASAKWAILAPVFVPMFMLLGYTPEFTQAAYRVGDSVSNVVSPMMSYFALIIAFVQKYEPKAGLGTVVALMLPYSVAFFLVWTTFLVAWALLGLPVGPGAPLLMDSPAHVQ